MIPSTSMFGQWVRLTSCGLMDHARCVAVRGNYLVATCSREKCYIVQRSVMEIAIPQVPLRTIVVNSNTSVVINGSDFGAVTFQGLSISTMQSSVLCSHVEIQGDELLLQSTSGDISVNSLTIDASNSPTAESPARVYSALGLVSLSNVVLSQCDLQAETGASSLVLSSVHRYNV